MATRPEKIIGTTKKYFQLKNVTTTKHAAKPHVTTGIASREALGRLASRHDKAAVKSNRTVTKSQKPV